MEAETQGCTSQTYRGLILLAAILGGCGDPAFQVNAMITVPVDLVQKYSPEKPGILILADGRAEKDELYKICGGDQVVTAVGEVGGLGCPSEVSAFISPAFATDDRPCGVIQDDDSERGYAKWPENRSQWPKVIAATAAGGRPCGFEQDMELTVVPSPD